MSMLFLGAQIIDGAGKALKDHGLLVEGGKIARIAPAGEFAGFAGQTVDAKGMSLLPGLIDCHVHLCMGAEGNPSIFVQTARPDQIAIRALEHAQITLRGGVTAVRDCGGKDYLEFGVRDACNAGKQLGPTIRAAGRMICMTGGHGNRYGRIADGVDDVVKAVREQVHAGSDLIKIMATGGVMTPGVNPEDAHYSPEELAAGIAEGHRFHKTCASHAQGEEGILNAVRGGIDSIEHGIFLTQQCIDEMLPRGTYIVPTLAAVNNIVANKDNGVPPYAYEKAARVAERHKQSILMFYKAGGNLAMGTDAGTPYNKHGENAKELEYMVEIGISAMDSITISTKNAADLMRLSDRGTLAEGLAADLLLVKGDPLSDIKAVARAENHVMVLKNGIAALDRRPGGVSAFPMAAE